MHSWMKAFSKFCKRQFSYYTKQTDTKETSVSEMQMFNNERRIKMGTYYSITRMTHQHK
jgi:hypothetical protein